MPIYNFIKFQFTLVLQDKQLHFQGKEREVLSVNNGWKDVIILRLEVVLLSPVQ